MRGGLYHCRAARSILGLALFAAVPAPAGAGPVEDEQLWLQVNTNVPLGNGLRLTLEQIARTSDRFDGLYQTEFGGILGYRLAANVEVGFGYRRVGTHNANPAADEDRIRQHVVATFGPVTTRLRLDERFNPRGDEVGFRIRPLVRYNHRLGRGGFGLFASHESFIFPNSTNWGQRAGYDRMRNSVGLILPLAKSVSADLGYLNQYRIARDGAPAQMDHALSLQLTINLSPGHPARADD